MNSLTFHPALHEQIEQIVKFLPRLNYAFLPHSVCNRVCSEENPDPFTPLVTAINMQAWPTDFLSPFLCE